MKVNPKYYRPTEVVSMKNRYLCSEAKTAILRGFVLMFESIFARVTKSQTIWAQGPQFGKTYLKLNLTKVHLLG